MVAYSHDSIDVLHIPSVSRSLNNQLVPLPRLGPWVEHDY